MPPARHKTWCVRPVAAPHDGPRCGCTHHAHAPCTLAAVGHGRSMMLRKTPSLSHERATACSLLVCLLRGARASCLCVCGHRATTTGATTTSMARSGPRARRTPYSLCAQPLGGMHHMFDAGIGEGAVVLRWTGISRFVTVVSRVVSDLAGMFPGYQERESGNILSICGFCTAGPVRLCPI